MANKILRTLSLGNESMDIPDAGNYMKMTDNKIGLNFTKDNLLWDFKQVNLPNATQISVSVVDVTKTGMYLVTWRAQYPANASGARYAVVMLENNSGSFVTAFSGSRTAAAPTGETYLSGAQVIDIDATVYKKIGLRMFQNCGSELKNATAIINAFYIER